MLLVFFMLIVLIMFYYICFWRRVRIVIRGEMMNSYRFIELNSRIFFFKVEVV